MRALVEKAGLAASVEVASAGTIGMHAGEPPDGRMRAAAGRRGYELAGRARQITREDLDRFDLVLTMDEDNRRNVLALAGSDAQRARVRRFAEFCRRHRVDAVPDPYYGGTEGFEHVLDLLEDGCCGVLDTIMAGSRD